MKWEKLQGLREEYSGPGKLWGHTCNAVKGGKSLYVFGGYGKTNCQTNQVHVFDTDKRTWSRPEIKGTPPVPRDSHSCTAIGDNLYVFGGTDGFRPLNDLHILDTSSHTWTSPNVRGEGPAAREGHSAAVVGKRLFIFGGCGKSSRTSNEIHYNDLYIFNTETLVWKCAMTSGIPPSARDSHTCSSWKNKIIVIGGEDQHDYYMSDVHIYDTDTHEWSELNTLGDRLPPRGGHTTISFGKYLSVFGGFTDDRDLFDDLHILDVETGVWTKVTATGEVPSGRFAASGDSLDPVKGGVQVLLGGCNNHLDALDDMYYLHTELVSDSGQEDQSLEKLSMRKQLKLKCHWQHASLPVHEKPCLTYGSEADSRQPIPVSVCNQPSMPNVPLHGLQHLQGKMSFQAKITESLTDGYTIETIIDGKLLRGVVFSSRPSLSITSNDNISRKKKADECGGVQSTDVHKRKSTAADHLEAEDVDTKESKKLKEIDSDKVKDHPTKAPNQGNGP